MAVTIDPNELNKLKPEDVPQQPPMSPVDLAATVATPLTQEPIVDPMAQMYTSLSEGEQKYYRSNPDLLPNRLRMDRLSILQGEKPGVPIEELYAQVVQEFESTLQEPVNLMPSAEPKTQKSPTVEPSENNDSWFKRLYINLPMRSASGVVSGAADFGLEATSGVARTLDYLCESAGYDLLNDEESWFYDIKEGLSEDTKESIKSIAGLYPKGDTWFESIGESFGSIIIGSYVLAAAAATGLGVRLGAALGATRGGTAVTGFLAKHQTLARVARLSAEGAMVDVSATVFTDPASVLALYGVGSDERAREFSEWYNSFDPITRRTGNLMEGLFMNLVIGALKGAPRPEYPLVPRDSNLPSTRPEVITDIDFMWDVRHNAQPMPSDGSRVLRGESADFRQLPNDMPEKLHQLFNQVKRDVLQIPEKTTVKADDVVNDVIYAKGPVTIYDNLDEDLVRRLKSTDDTLFSLDEETVFDSAVKSLDDDLEVLFKDEVVVFDNTSGKLVKSKAPKKVTPVTDEAIKEVTPEQIKATEIVEVSTKVSESTPELTAKEVARADLSVEKSLGDTSETRVLPVILDETTKGSHSSIGAAHLLSGVKFTDNPLDPYIYSKIRGALSKNTGIEKLSWDDLPKGVKQRDAKARAKEMYEGIVSAIQGSNTKVSYEDAFKGLIHKTIEYSDGAWRVNPGVVIHKKGYDSILSKQKLTNEQFTSMYSVGKRGKSFVPLDAAIELAKMTGRFTISAIKLAAPILAKSGLMHGVTAGVITNMFGLDITRDGEVDLRDLATVAMLFAGGTYISKSRANKLLNAEVASREALVSTLKTANKDIHASLVAARAVANRVARSTAEADIIKTAQKTVKHLEDYLYSTKEGIEDIYRHPTLTSALKANTLVLDGAALQNLRLALQNTDVNKLEVGNLVTFDKFDFSNFTALDQAFKKIFGEFSIVTHDTRVVKGLSEKAHLITKQTEDLLSEFGVPQDITNNVWKRLTVPEQAAMTHTARTIIGSIDSKLRQFARVSGDLTPSDLYEFMGLVNQRRAVGEYLKSGGVASKRLNVACGYTAKGAVISTFHDTMITGLKEYPAIKDTLETLRSYMGIDPNLKGTRLTELVDFVGANMSVGKLLVHAQYMSMYSHPLTWAKPFIENSVGLTTGVTSEAISAIMRGQFQNEIIGPHGMLMGIANNLGAAARAYGDRAMGKAAGLDTSAAKEMFDYRFAEVMSRTMGLEDPDFLNMTFRKVVDSLGINPLDMTSAPDVMFKQLAFGGYENLLVMRKATDAMRATPGLTMDQALINIRLDKSAMAQIREEALMSARKLTYTDILKKDSLAQKAIDLLQHPMLRMLIPIIRTPLVSARFAIRHSPFNGLLIGDDRMAISKAIDAWNTGATMTAVDKRNALGVVSRATAGVLLSYGMYNTITASGWEIIGTGEYDPAFKAKAARGARQNGLWHSKSGTFIDLERSGLFKMTLGTMADMYHWMTKNQTQVSDEEREGYAMALGYMMYSTITQAQPDQVDDIKSLLGGFNKFEMAKKLTSEHLGSIFSRAIPNVFKVEGRASDPHRRAYTGSWQSAVNAIYSGMGRGESVRPTLDAYGNRVENSRSLISTQGIPEGDELYSEAEAAGYDLKGALSRRSRIGGMTLGNTEEEQGIAYLAEEYHGKQLAKSRDSFLRDLKRTQDPVVKHELFSRLFRSITTDVKSQLQAHPKLGATVRRLLDQGGRK
jgi:hypothetical protein